MNFVSTANAEIKAKMKEMNVKAYQIAIELNKSDSWIYSNLRRPLKPETAKQLLDAIEKIGKERRCEKI